jgi:hypothetical protein
MVKRVGAGLGEWFPRPAVSLLQVLGGDLRPDEGTESRTGQQCPTHLHAPAVLGQRTCRLLQYRRTSLKPSAPSSYLIM